MFPEHWRLVTSCKKDICIDHSKFALLEVVGHTQHKVRAKVATGIRIRRKLGLPQAQRIIERNKFREEWKGFKILFVGSLLHNVVPGKKVYRIIFAFWCEEANEWKLSSIRSDSFIDAKYKVITLA